MGYSSNKAFNSVYYRFKLYQEDGAKIENRNIDGHTFYTDKWTVYKTQPPYSLQKFVRTVLNRSNILQYQEFNPVTEEIYFDSDKYLREKPEYFSRDVLSIFDRRKIEDICNFYGINTKNIMTKALVNHILKAQEQYKQMENDGVTN